MRKLSNFVRSLLIAIGSLSGFVTILWAFFSSSLSSLANKCPWGLLFGLLLVAIIYALYANRSKSKIELGLSDKVKAKIFFGDLFESKEIIVVPVNEYFDTIVDDKIISSNTIHGKFVQKYFGGNEAELKKQIKKELAQYAPLETNSDRKYGNKNKYSLGTVCEIKNGNKVFYLVALTRFNANHRAEVKNSEYLRVLCDLFSYIEQNSQGRKVSIPLIGAGHSGVSLSKQKLLEFLLFSIALKDDLTLINGVNIVLHESIKKEIDLSSTEILFNTIRA
ncbi:MAG: hypothetical protein HFP77_00740 [Methylococcales symbiont of Iophon sp. n. MRB-2018]|nr:MAG: hypothetical protein HFP77_00740 [Methylococcales symbiont of Iophon sp. n. MRB-2018]KAF3980695.1 MAG: hypothetical protein HFP76_00750 [Methylococcales symbiont of Iophon sp. n. MRB-2018]